jgi:hypothetical protein
MLPRASLAFAACSLVLLLAACGDDDGDPSTPAGGSPSVVVSGTRPASTGGTEGGPEPRLAMPASRFALTHEDIGSGYLTDLNATFVLTARLYGGTTAFASATEGEAMLKKWGYLGGYETGYEPEKRQVSVLQGGYYINVETHLFDTVEGAKQAYAYFETLLRNAPRTQQVTTRALANQSSGWKAVSDKVPNSDIDGVLHRFIFRRGNLIGIVKTYGADPFMSIDIARELAVKMDEKALGQRKADEPTPIPTPNLSQ